MHSAPQGTVFLSDDFDKVGVLDLSSPEGAFFALSGGALYELLRRDY